MEQDKRLANIDAKLSGVLDLLTRGLSPEQQEGVEVTLRRAGLSTAEISELLGKSRRWVQASLKTQGFSE